MNRTQAIAYLSCVAHDLDALAEDCTHLTHAEVSDQAQSMGEALYLALEILGLSAEVAMQAPAPYGEDS